MTKKKLIKINDRFSDFKKQTFFLNSETGVTEPNTSCPQVSLPPSPASISKMQISVPLGHPGERKAPCDDDRSIAPLLGWPGFCRCHPGKPLLTTKCPWTQVSGSKPRPVAHNPVVATFCRGSVRAPGSAWSSIRNPPRPVLTLHIALGPRSAPGAPGPQASLHRPSVAPVPEHGGRDTAARHPAAAVGGLCSTGLIDILSNQPTQCCFFF
uniref:Uncharacterized protein n=1 Tax=Pipistrellus kuhlii TaxID=59472 RepID=A0A7J7ZJW5_PIPKU|nr:hypothetical protein mPipKuh1_009653 [Pipistrellus kuhlii]